MDLQRQGLRAALTPDWRGGRTARVIEGGRLRVGDALTLVPAAQGCAIACAMVAGPVPDAGSVFQGQAWVWNGASPGSTGC